jgi:hypothetical protein
MDSYPFLEKVPSLHFSYYSTFSQKAASRTYSYESVSYYDQVAPFGLYSLSILSGVHQSHFFSQAISFFSFPPVASAIYHAGGA